MNILCEYNHLGSSSYLTNSYGMPSHYYNYLPFGEEGVSQNQSEYNNVYRFSAKELDDETQLSYFGARYYDARLSVSVCDVLGIGTKLICGDYGDATENMLVNLAGEVTEGAINRTISGPNPDVNISTELKDLIQSARTITRETGGEKSKEIATELMNK